MPFHGYPKEVKKKYVLNYEYISNPFAKLIWGFINCTHRLFEGQKCCWLFSSLAFSIYKCIFIIITLFFSSISSMDKHLERFSHCHILVVFFFNYRLRKVIGECPFECVRFGVWTRDIRISRQSTAKHKRPGLLDWKEFFNTARWVNFCKLYHFYFLAAYNTL